MTTEGLRDATQCLLTCMTIGTVSVALAFPDKREILVVAAAALAEAKRAMRHPNMREYKIEYLAEGIIICAARTYAFIYVAQTANEMLFPS